MKKHQIDVVSGIGRLMGPSIFSPQAGAVSVETSDGESHILSPRFTLIATGSRPKSLPGLEIDGEIVMTSDHALERPTLPASVVIVGAGAIGVEWASLYSDLGVDVTLVEFLPRVLPLEDEDVSAEVARLLKKRKVRVLTGAKVLPETLERRSDGLTVVVDMNGKQETLSAEVMLVAVGREPVIEDIGLEATEIQSRSRRYCGRQRVIGRRSRTFSPLAMSLADSSWHM